MSATTAAEATAKQQALPRKKARSRNLPLYLMLIPGIVFVFIFSYVPMYGIVMAFQKFIPARGLFGDQKWVGLKNITDMFAMPTTYQVLWNTIFISLMKMILGIVVPLVAALLLHEVAGAKFRKFVQTSIFLPYFLSWVILGGIMVDIFSPNTGIVNELLKVFGLKPIFFLGDNHIFPYLLAASDTWKNYGYGAIIYIAALAGIDPTLYEAAYVDGAGRWKRLLHVTLPGISGTVILMSVLSLGNILNAGFDQVFVLYSPQVYESGDIIDTMVYRLGLMNYQYSLATAVGLLKSIVSTILIAISYILAYRVAKYRIF